MIVCMNHKLSPEQVASLPMGERIVYLPNDLQVEWVNVDPMDDERMKNQVNLIFRWIRANHRPLCMADTMEYQYDVDGSEDEHKVLVAGEPGATLMLVSMLISEGIDCFYATTKREAVETVLPDGSTKKESRFVHIQFRQYKIWRDGYGLDQ